VKQISWPRCWLAVFLGITGLILVVSQVVVVSTPVLAQNHPAQEPYQDPYPDPGDPAPPPERPTPPGERPTPDLPEVPPTTGPTASNPSSSTGDAPTPVPAGRITGTVIDTTTGEPVPGVPVQVGDEIVYTDENGNYERVHLEPGDYAVEVLVDPETGIPAQGTVYVQVPADTSVTQHLFLASQQQATPTATAAPEPTSEPAGGVAPVQPTSTALPPAPVPIQLPETADGGNVQHGPSFWLAIGLLLLLAGGALWRTGRRSDP
jgi:hypothetical protein